MFNDFFDKNGVCFRHRKFNFDHQNYRDKYPQMRNEIWEKIKIPDFSFENIFFSEFCKTGVLTAIICLVRLMNKRIINRGSLCLEYKRNSFSINKRSIQAVKYNPL